MTTQRKDEMPEVWISWKEMIRQPSGEKWPCVFDHKRDYAVKYTRADLSPPVPDDVADASKILGNLVAVWQSLPAGNYSPDRIQSFMYDLKSIVDEARTVIRSDNKSSIPNAIVEAVKWAKSVKELSDIRISGEEFYADDHAKSKHLATLIRAASTPSPACDVDPAAYLVSVSSRGSDYVCKYYFTTFKEAHDDIRRKFPDSGALVTPLYHHPVPKPIQEDTPPVPDDVDFDYIRNHYELIQKHLGENITDAIERVIIRAASTPSAEVRALQKIPLSASTSGDFIAPDYIKGWNAAIDAMTSKVINKVGEKL